MKILLVNKFFFRKGGAESVFFETAKLLKEKGHEVSFFSMMHPDNYPSRDQRYFVSNIDYETGTLKDKVWQAGRLLYSFEARRKIRKLVKNAKPDVAHIHNIYHQISPSILHVLKELNIPTVMTLHDYKMVCGNYTMLSPQGICEKCSQGRYYQCLIQNCTKGSRFKSLLNAGEMYLHHRIMDIYGLVDVLVSPSEFLIGKMAEMGFNRKIVHLPNFVNAGSFEPRYGWSDRTIVYLGRLSREKGLHTLITAVKQIGGITLAIIGDGPDLVDLQKRIGEERIENVKLLGYKTGEALTDEIGRSMFGIIPSECYENSPMSLIEQFAAGKPAVGSRIGGIPELIEDGERGLLFEPGDPDDLRVKIAAMLRDTERLRQMGEKARRYAEEKLNPDGHYRRLIEIYEGLT